MRVRIIKDYGDFKKGEVKEVEFHYGDKLIRIGVAEFTKDMVTRDYLTKGN